MHKHRSWYQYCMCDTQESLLPCDYTSSYFADDKYTNDTPNPPKPPFKVTITDSGHQVVKRHISMDCGDGYNRFTIKRRCTENRVHEAVNDRSIDLFFDVNSAKSDTPL